MQTHILCRGFNLTKAIKSYTEQRLQSALNFAALHIGSVKVRLSDINGPKGGEDKRCQLVLTIKGMPSVIVEDIQSNLYAAIDHAIDRAAQTMSRVLDRKHHYRHDLKPLSSV